MKSIIVLFLFSFLPLGTIAGNVDVNTSDNLNIVKENEKTLNHSLTKNSLNEILVFAQQQLKVLVSNVESLTNQEAGQVEPISCQFGDLELTNIYDWRSGFYSGLLWQMYQFTQDEFWKEKAVLNTWLLEPVKTFSKHDLGFMVNNSFGKGYDVTNDPSYKEVMVKSANTLISRFNSTVGCIKSWNSSKKYEYPVIIDNMMNLELLFRATQLTGDSTYWKIACSHADKTIVNHFREDGSSYHVVDFDSITGSVTQKRTSQGYSDESYWSRGQAWGLYGFTMCYRYTRSEKYLNQALKIADFLIGLEYAEDLIPYWDMLSPDIPNTVRDASAAAIMASAFIELSNYCDIETGKVFLRRAEDIVWNLHLYYESTIGDNCGFLLQHSTQSYPTNYDIDVPLIYTDYYYLETLGRLMKRDDLELSDIQKIQDRFYKTNAVEFNDSIIKCYLSLMNEDGSFSDIDYHSTNVVYWEPIYHLDRLIVMAYAYTTPNNFYYENADLFSRIETSISFWYENNPVSNNWWFWTVAEPQRIGTLFIALRKGKENIKREQELILLTRCKNRAKKPKNNVVNIADAALGNLYYALLTEDEEFLITSIDKISSTISYNNGIDGFQSDNSYHAHGSQLYIGGYGVNHLLVLTAVGYCIKGTKFDYGIEEKQILSTFVRKTLASCIRGQVMLYNCIGRNISRVDDLILTPRFLHIAERMKEIDSTNVIEYVNMVKRLTGEMNSSYAVKEFDSYYPCSDFYLHVRPEYNFSVRMNSINAIRPECGTNNENLLGYYLGDGSTCLTKSGYEYLNIMPLWQWDRIPGVTCPLSDTIPVSDGLGSQTTYCGGVSDFLSCGIASFRYYDTLVQSGASKAYFAFDDEIVCLGAGLNSNLNLVTTIEQCWGDISYDVVLPSGIECKDGNRYGDFYNTVLGIRHKGMGYYFPQFGKVFVSNALNEGNWRTISNEQPDSLIYGKVFTLSMSHDIDDIKKGKDSYSYVLLPNVGNTAELKTYISNPDVEIVNNSDSIQIVYDKSSNCYGVVFYKGCEYNTGDGNYYFNASAPCIFILKNDNGEVYISDPYKKESEISIAIKTPEMPDLKTGTVYYGDDDLFPGITKYVQLEKSNSTGIKHETNDVVSFSVKKRCIYLWLHNNQYINGTLRVFNIKGEEIFAQKIIDKSVVLNNLQKSVYYVTITNGKEMIVQKILVE